MSLTFGQNKILSCPKNALFGGAIGVHFVSFYFEHPADKKKFEFYVNYGFIDRSHTLPLID